MSEPRYYYPAIDEAIAAYLRRRNLKQAQLASEMGMAENTSSWKRRGVRDWSLPEAREDLRHRRHLPGRGDSRGRGARAGRGVREGRGMRTSIDIGGLHEEESQVRSAWILGSLQKALARELVVLPILADYWRTVRLICCSYFLIEAMKQSRVYPMALAAYQSLHQ